MRLWPRRRVYLDDLPKTHDLRFGMFFLVGLLALGGALYGVGHVVAGDTVPTGTTVSGVDIGGMSSGQAATVLRERMSPRLSRSVTVLAGGRTFHFTPQQAGLTFDVDQTVADALGGNSWDPRHMLEVLTGGGAVEPVVDVDRHDLETRLDTMAKQVAVPAVDASVSFRGGQPQLVAGQTGTRLDLGVARANLLAALIEGQATVRAPLQAVQPGVTTSQAADFVAGPATRSTAGPVVVDVADTAVTLQPRRYAPALRVLTQDSGLHLDLDPHVLFARTRSMIHSLPNHPVDAQFRFEDGRPVVVPSRSGATVSRTDWADAVLEAVLRPAGKREVAAGVVAEPADFTTAQARQLQIKERLSASVAPYPPHVDPAAVRRSAQRLDGTVLRPRWSFSFLHRVGVDDPVAASTVASAAYEAALQAGMTGIVRSAWSSRPPGFVAGFDARVDSPEPDLRWDDDTPYGVYVRSWVDQAPSEGAVHVEIWSSRYWRVELHAGDRHDFVEPPVQVGSGGSCEPLAGAPGYTVDVVRTLTRHGQQHRENFRSSYRPRAERICSTIGP
ncbi:MAG: VanW family protein [Nocardioidaceae bacterium]